MSEVRTIVDLYDYIVEGVREVMTKEPEAQPFVIVFVRNGKPSIVPDELVKLVDRNALPQVLRETAMIGNYDHVIIIAESIMQNLEQKTTTRGVSVLIDGDFERTTVIYRGQDGRPSGEEFIPPQANAGFFSNLIQRGPTN
jgi:hypothetical protein